MKRCVLDPKKICNGCNRCNVCDLDPNKLCDNCFKCLALDERDYIDIPISNIYTEVDDDAFELSNLNVDFLSGDPAIQTLHDVRGRRKR